VKNIGGKCTESARAKGDTQEKEKKTVGLKGEI
jgi:hypothetical protein